MESLMTLQKRKVKITNDKWISLNEQTLFKANGEEGLHLWEASIVLARYLNKNNELFKGKDILELGTGCGLVGISALLYTECSNIVFTDYIDSVLNNLIQNIKYNTTGQEDRYKVVNIDWRDYEKYKTESYDYLIGSELIYDGGYIEELAKLMRNLLKPDGKALIMMPEKRSQTSRFIKYIEENEMTWTCEEVIGEELLDPVLEDEKESKKLFENLKKMKIMLYTISRVVAPEEQNK